MRQVTHALLTRPPLRLLSSIRKLPTIISVRLACVKHAASVHPEPGSNSQIKFNSVQNNSGLHSFFRKIKQRFVPLSFRTLLFLRYDFSSSQNENFKWIFRVVLLFNYQGSLLFAVLFLPKQLNQFTTVCCVCQALFWIILKILFFKTFQTFASFRQLSQYNTEVLLCQYLFSTFFISENLSQKGTEKEGFEPSRRY